MQSNHAPSTPPKESSAIPIQDLWYHWGHCLWEKNPLSKGEALAKHKRVGELLHALRICDPSVVLTDAQKDPGYWTSQAMMRPGLEVAKLEAHLLIRKAEFSTP